MNRRPRDEPNPLRVGIDEAGLGPRLGPLAIGVMAIEGPDELHHALAGAIVRPGEAGEGIEVGDSKAVHRGVHKLARLERSVLATWLWVNEREVLPASTQAWFSETVEPPRRHALWHGLLPPRLPLVCDAEEIMRAAAQLRATAQASGVVPRRFQAALISARELNEELLVEAAAGGSKNTWALHRCLCLCAAVLEAGPAHVVCDKAGGRSRYADALARAFVDQRTRVLREHASESRYTLSPADPADPEAQAWTIAFRPRADATDPRVAWASMLAKYLRELSMLAFNAWFRAHDSQLRPTAGYPLDARRFIAEALPHARRAGLSELDWIRSR